MTAASPKAHPIGVTAHESRKPEGTSQPAGRSTGWRVSLLGSLAGLSSPRKLRWPKSILGSP